jgi:hypothetical protein
MEEQLSSPPARTPDASEAPALVLDRPIPVAQVRKPDEDSSLEFDVGVPSRVVTPPIYANPVAHRIGARVEVEERPTKGVGERLRAPLGVLMLALLVAGADIGWFRITGEHWTLGPIRPFWVAAPLALFGVGLTLWRMMEDHGD